MLRYALSRCASLVISLIVASMVIFLIIEIVPGGSPFDLEPGDVFTDTQGSVSLISLLLKFVSGQGSDE